MEQKKFNTFFAACEKMSQISLEFCGKGSIKATSVVPQKKVPVIKIYATNPQEPKTKKLLQEIRRLAKPFRVTVISCEPVRALKKGEPCGTKARKGKPSRRNSGIF